VHVYVGTLANEQADRPTVRNEPQFDALSRTYLDAIHAAESRTGEHPVTFVLAPFAPAEFESAKAHGMAFGPTVLIQPYRVLTGPPRPVPYDTLVSSSPGLTIATALGILALLFVVGFGWARASIRHPVSAFALAPAFGAAALLLGGIAFERVDVALTGAGPALISVAVGAGGYALWWWRHRVLRRLRERETLAEAPA
jgi:hypothetical protein